MFKHMHYEKQLVVLRKAVRVLINDFILRLMCVCMCKRKRKRKRLEG
jgi:hypothetical protein